VHACTGNPATFLQAELSRDGHWLIVAIRHGWNATDLYIADRRGRPVDEKPTFTPLVTGRGALYFATAWQDRFYIHTNDGAPRYRVFRADPVRPARADWTEIVPEAGDAVLEHLTIAGGRLVLTLIRNAAHELEVRSIDGDFVRRVELPAGSTLGALTSDPDEDDAYASTSSFTRPTEVYRTSIATGATTLWSAIRAPIDLEPYLAEQVWYPSRDGTRIPMFIVRRRDMPRDGSTPFLLTGYGGFNVSQLPAFAPGLFAWLEAGGAFGVANLRGGGEFGEEWHKAGMLAAKQNVFDDFIAAAEHLVGAGYTRPERLAIRGGSNGGLLVGAALTQRPELFRAVICGAPLLDMLRYHLFGSGKTWMPEYGNPEREADFRVLATYSPYHRVTPGTAYPALLMMSPANDDRVDPMHARKMVAALQAATASPHPILLRIEAHAGHGGADLVRKQIDSLADSYAFLRHELGMSGDDAAPRQE
jgi:prolyl oligopeptidase